MNLNRQKSLGIFICLLMLIALFGFAAGPAGADRVENIQPLLQQMASQDGNQTVSIIVQKADDSGRAEVRLAELQGVVIQDLSIINSFEAQMTAAAARELAGDPAVRWVSLNAPVIKSGKGGGGGCTECLDVSRLESVYIQTIGANQLWNSPPYLQGQGVTVAVVDSGFSSHLDLAVQTNGNNAPSRILAKPKFNSFTNTAADHYGHSAHIMGIIGGNGAESKGIQMGIAPKVNLISVKVSDDRGAGTTADVIAGLQWVYDNKDVYNIRVVNLSLNSSVQESYHTSPLSAAVEILWFNGVVVVVSAGNNGVNDNGVLYPPANDPFVITVGASDDKGTIDPADDTLASFSAYGLTADGHPKPEIIAPGTNIISLLAGKNVELAKGHPEHRVDGFAGGRDFYFRMSGTSMAAGVVSGSSALLLQDEPNLTPDQVKYRLMATARPFNGPSVGGFTPGYLDIYAAVKGNTTASANSDLQASMLLWSGSEPVMWNSVAWNSVAWNSVAWNSVAWNSVAWNSVSWDD